MEIASSTMNEQWQIYGYFNEILQCVNINIAYKMMRPLNWKVAPFQCVMQVNGKSNECNSDVIMMFSN